MVRKRPYHTPHFKISQYVVATCIGLIAATFAPKESQSKDAQGVIDLFTINEAPTSVARWWEIPSVPACRSSRLYPWIQYWSDPSKSSTFERGWHTLSLDDFRCRGCGDRAPLTIEEAGTKTYLFDCWGLNHGLPWIWLDNEQTSVHKKVGKERVQPALIEILNALQHKLHASVTITSGHRCYSHHRYITQGKGSSQDKHLIAAAADFYLPSWTNSPKVVVAAINTICCERAHLLPANRPAALVEKAPHHWVGGEIELKYYESSQDRNLDTPAAQPYYEMIIRYDYERKQEVMFSATQARMLPLE